MTKEALRQELAEEIRKAYKEVEYPGEDHFELGHEVESFRGYTWQDIPIDILILRRDELHYLTPEAFAYFLPAFLIAILLNSNEVDSLHPNLLFFYLVPPQNIDGKSSEYTDYRRQRLSKIREILTASQKRAIFKVYDMYSDLFPDHELSLEEEGLRDRALTYWASGQS